MQRQRSGAPEVERGSFRRVTILERRPHLGLEAQRSRAHEPGGGAASVSAQRQRELSERHRCWRLRRRLRRESMFGQQAGDGGLLGRGLEPAHRSAAQQAGVHVGAEHMPEKPAPARPCGGVRRAVGVSRREPQLELVTGSRRRSETQRVEGMGLNARLRWWDQRDPSATPG